MVALPHTSGSFALAIDGAPDASFISSLEGGELKANNATQKTGGTMYAMTNNTTVEVNPFKAEVGMACSKTVLKWINKSWERDYARKTGAWVVLNQRREVVFTRNFYDAVITETKFPALDCNNGKPAYLGLTIHPEYIKDEPDDGKKNKLPDAYEPLQRLWSPANFRLNIDHSDFTEAAKKVTKIDEMTIKQKVKSLWVGSDRFPTVEPCGIEFPNVTFHLPAHYAKPFMNWHRDMVIKGGTILNKGVSASIEFLDPQTKKILFELDLYDLGISAVTIDKSQGGSEKLQSAKIELFCHYMKLDWANAKGLGKG